MPLLGDPGHREMVDRLKEFARQIQKPSAILVISAHWEEPVPTITSGANPSLIYDYYGFPAESYEIEYPCPGEPDLANQAYEALKQAGLPVQLDDARGFDHGLFVPLKIMYPEADIPCIQLSLVSNLDANTHLAIGRALKTLNHENLLVIGSGFSFHNMKAFFSEETPEITNGNLEFERWLEATCTDRSLSEADRVNRLVHWEQAPYARFCHPREEHLLPLHVCYGLASKPSDEHLSVTVLGKRAGMFYWSVCKES